MLTKVELFMASFVHTLDLRLGVWDVRLHLGPLAT